jgi:hypothetical protein
MTTATGIMSVRENIMVKDHIGISLKNDAMNVNTDVGTGSTTGTGIMTVIMIMMITI